MIPKISGAILAVADQDVMAEFFVDKLGFVKTTDAEMWPGARWVEVSPPGAETRLVLNAAKDFDREPDKGYPMVFDSDDLAGLVTSLRSAGVTVTDPVTESWGTFINVTDPEDRQLLIGTRSSG
jgi:predicted enzyme related to lactoylglutathione lyase